MLYFYSAARWRWKWRCWWCFDVHVFCSVLQCTSVQCAVCSVQCAVCSVQCTDPNLRTVPSTSSAGNTQKSPSPSTGRSPLPPPPSSPPPSNLKSSTVVTQPNPRPISAAPPPSRPPSHTQTARTHARTQPGQSVHHDIPRDDLITIPPIHARTPIGQSAQTHP